VVNLQRVSHLVNNVLYVELQIDHPAESSIIQASVQIDVSEKSTGSAHVISASSTLYEHDDTSVDTHANTIAALLYDESQKGAHTNHAASVLYDSQSSAHTNHAASVLYDSQSSAHTNHAASVLYDSQYNTNSNSHAANALLFDIASSAAVQGDSYAAIADEYAEIESEPDVTYNEIETSDNDALTNSSIADMPPDHDNHTNLDYNNVGSNTDNIFLAKLR
jgi:hypothetical protein